MIFCSLQASRAATRLLDAAALVEAGGRARTPLAGGGLVEVAAVVERAGRLLAPAARERGPGDRGALALPAWDAGCRFETAGRREQKREGTKENENVNEKHYEQGGAGRLRAEKPARALLQ